MDEVRMKFIQITTLLFAISFFSNIYATAEKYESRYTTLDEKQCITLYQEQESIVQECPGFGGYQLHASEFDLRQSITLLKDGREFPLQYWDTVSPAFSTLGKKAEWRFIKINKKPIPIALITRLNVVTGEEADETTSWLVVSKLTDKQVCVVGKIPPQRDGSQNGKARDMADKAEGMPCLR